MLGICCCVYRGCLGQHECETVVVSSREGCPSLLSGMGVPEGQMGRPGGLVGPQGPNVDKLRGSTPDRVDRLFDFCTPFIPPVYSIPGVRRV